MFDFHGSAEDCHFSVKRMLQSSAERSGSWRQNWRGIRIGKAQWGKKWWEERFAFAFCQQLQELLPQHRFQTHSVQGMKAMIGLLGYWLPYNERGYHWGTVAGAAIKGCKKQVRWRNYCVLKCCLQRFEVLSSALWSVVFSALKCCHQWKKQLTDDNWIERALAETIV